MVRACATRNCAKELVVRYSVPQRIGADFLGRFEPIDVRVHSFSEHVAGAFDHFEVDVGALVTLRGALKGHELLVRFKRPSDRHVATLVAAFERALELWGYGAVRYVPGRWMNEGTGRGATRSSARM